MRQGLLPGREQVNAPVPEGHAGLKDYERGTTRFLGETGHWHALPNGGRRWIKGPASACQVKR